MTQQQKSELERLQKEINLYGNRGDVAAAVLVIIGILLTEVPAESAHKRESEC